MKVGRRAKSAIARVLAIVVLVLVVIAAIGGTYYYVNVIGPPPQNGSTPSPSPFPTPIASPTPTPTANPTPSPTPTPIVTPTPSPTRTSAPSSTPTPIITSTPSPTPIVTPTPSPTPTPTPTPTSTPTPTPPPKYSLSEAMTAGYVQANITGKGLGVSSGDAIILDIQRLVNYTIEIEPIPSGTLLMASGNYQNMAIHSLRAIWISYPGFGYYVTDKIILDTSNREEYLFSGYCLNFSLSTPTIVTRFSMNGLADANVLKIYSVLNQLPANVTGVAAIQTAIYVVTDNVSQSELQSRFPSGVAEIQNVRTILETAGIDVSIKRLFTS